VRRRSDPFRRPQRDLALSPRVLIGCEGVSTEPGYLHALRMARRLSERQVVLVRHEGTDPVTVVETVAGRRALLRREGRWDDDLDTAWAVFDDDDRQHLHPAQWNDAVQRAQAWGVRLIVSNPCFELWYLLHFQQQAGPVTRQEVVRRLRGHVPEYEKSSSLYREFLAERTTGAMERADELAARAVRDGLGTFPNPSTNVGELVLHLLTLRPGR
jgi:hypothetical protein